MRGECLKNIILAKLVTLNMNNFNPTIGFNVKHILTKFDKIDRLDSYDSQIYNFYISIGIPIKVIADNSN